MCNNILSLDKDITATDQNSRKCIVAKQRHNNGPKKVGRPGAQYIEQTSGPQLGGNLCLLPLLLGNTPSIASLLGNATFCKPEARTSVSLPHPTTGSERFARKSRDVVEPLQNIQHIKFFHFPRVKTKLYDHLLWDHRTIASNARG